MSRPNDRGPTGGASPRSARIPARLIRGVLAVTALVIAGATFAVAKPSWWRPPEGAIRGGVMSGAAPAGAAVGATGGAATGAANSADERARALEQGLAAEFTRVRPAGERWAVRIREEDANAWLALRLPRWLAHDRELPWPEGIELVQFDFAAPDRLTVGAERGGWIWSATVRPRIEDGVLALRPSGGAVGRLWIPWIGASEGGGAAGLVAAFVPELSRPAEAQLELPDGRRVKLLDVEFDRGEMRLLCETLPR